MRSLLLLATLVLPSAASAQAPRDSVIATINEFFRAMTAKDSAASAAVLHPDGVMFSSSQRGDSTTLRRSTFASYLGSITTMKGDLLERMWEPTVLVHRQLATVWTAYDFHTDKKFSHCGVDVFNLMRHQGRWKIVSVAYTVEPTGCAESPLGKPKQ
ncbi:MAG: nuclear transport factor 2 family protein [Cytophagaceae bacterium]|nr:nuclear transport factor 2 family protein [Gemmatimonadaceae bacterium]